MTVKKEGKGKVKIYVLELGGGGSRDDVQKVKVKLSPLLNKETLLEQYQKRYPERVQEIVDKSIKALYKDVDDGSTLGEQF